MPIRDESFVHDSSAVVEGVDLGHAGPLSEQARLADFYFPQRGIFAVGSVFVTDRTSSEKVAARLRGEPDAAPNTCSNRSELNPAR